MMKKLAVVAAILFAGFIVYYLRSNFLEQRNIRIRSENFIEESTGFDVDLRDEFNALRDMEDYFSNDPDILEDLEKINKDIWDSMDEVDMQKVINDIEQNGNDLKDALDNYFENQ